MQGRIFRWKTAAEQFAYYDSGKYSAPYMSNLSGTSYYNRFVLATEETNLPLMKKGRDKGWIKGDPNIFYRDEAQRVTSLRDNEFGSNTALTSFIEFEHFGITTLPSKCFSGCTNLSDIIYPHTLKSIASNGTFFFYHCYKIKELPDMTNLSVANYGTGNGGGMGNWAAGCNTVKEVKLANSAKNYYRSCFYGLANLSEVIIPSGATYIHYTAFGLALEKLTFLDGGSLTLYAASIYFKKNVPHIIVCERSTCPTLNDTGEVTGADIFQNAQNTTIYYPAGSDYSHWMTFAHSGLKTNCRFIPCQRGEDGHLVIPEEN